jgi:hypothetical protein
MTILRHHYIGRRHSACPSNNPLFSLDAVTGERQAVSFFEASATDARGTSVGSVAIERFLRPVCYQGYPDANLPPALQDANPLNLIRLIDGIPTSAAVYAALIAEARS